MPDLPDEEWPDTWLEFQNGFNRQVLSAIAQTLPIGNSDLVRFKDVDLIHGTVASITSPLGQGVPIQQIIPVGCLGVTVDSTGNPTRSYYNLAVPQIEWHLSSKPDINGNNQALVTPYFSTSGFASGFSGQQIRAFTPFASKVTLSVSGNTFDVASIALDAGTWDISAVGEFGNGGVTSTQSTIGISTTSATMPGTGSAGDNRVNLPIGPGALGQGVSLVIPQYRVTPTTTTTYFLVAQSTYSAGTPAAWGRVSAVRAQAYLTGVRGRVRLLFIGGA